jgi:hypothetical protein
LLLENLRWMAESLDQLMVLCRYRSDNRPDLPDTEQIPLARLELRF